MYWKLPHFAGQIEQPYSVAQHCVEASYLCNEPLRAFLHDASEAYTGDAPTPLKDLLGDASAISKIGCKPPSTPSLASLLANRTS